MGSHHPIKRGSEKTGGCLVGPGAGFQQRRRRRGWEAACSTPSKGWVVCQTTAFEGSLKNVACAVSAWALRSTSAMYSSRIAVMLRSTLGGISLRTFSFSLEMMHVKLPVRRAARMLSLTPPIGNTCPRG